MLFIWLFSRAQTRQLNPAFRKRRQHRSEWGCISLTTVQRPSRENRRYYRKLSVINIQVGFSKLQQGYWSSLFPSLSRSRRRETAKGSGTRQFWGPCSPRALLTPPFPWTTCPPPPRIKFCLRWKLKPPLSTHTLRGEKQTELAGVPGTCTPAAPCDGLAWSQLTSDPPPKITRSGETMRHSHLTHNFPSFHLPVGHT